MMLIPIGKFSQMTRLSPKALRMYDSSGLLTPAHIDPVSGYRYYELAQANRAEAVRILRSVKMPLDEIKQVLDHDNPDLVHKQLEVHRERLAERLLEDQRMLSYLESLMNRTEGVMPYTIKVEDSAPRLVAATRADTSLARLGENIRLGFARLLPALGQAGIEPNGPYLVVYHDIIDEESNGDIEVCIPIADAFTDTTDIYSREIDGGAVATTVHHGRYEEIVPAYHTLIGWISKNDHEITGPPREIYLNDPQAVQPDDLQTRVEFPIKPTAN